MSFDNAISAQSILYPNKKWQFKTIMTTISPSMSSINYNGAPNMVCYLMEQLNMCTDKTKVTVTKRKFLMLLRETLGTFLKIITYQ